MAAAGQLDAVLAVLATTALVVSVALGAPVTAPPTLATAAPAETEAAGAFVTLAAGETATGAPALIEADELVVVEPATLTTGRLRARVTGGASVVDEATAPSPPEMFTSGTLVVELETDATGALQLTLAAGHPLTEPATLATG
jgi:hypothetical protein